MEAVYILEYICCIVDFHSSRSLTPLFANR